jgi:hypothetical protein
MEKVGREPSRGGGGTQNVFFSSGEDFKKHKNAPLTHTRKWTQVMDMNSGHGDLDQC